MKFTWVGRDEENSKKTEKLYLNFHKTSANTHKHNFMMIFSMSRKGSCVLIYGYSSKNMQEAILIFISNRNL